jgi:enoyl-CoA hydratase
MAKYIESARSGVVQLVILKRPPANALDIQTLEEIRDAFESIAADKEAGAVLFTGHGKAFCTGLDLKIVPSYSKDEQNRLLDTLNGAISALYRCPVPVVGAVNGHAIASGLVLALCCDWRIAAETNFQVGLAEVKVGVPFPLAAIEVVRAEMSAQVARQFGLSGENVPSAAALKAGIFDESAPAGDLLERSIEKARRFAELPKMAFAKIKLQLRRPALNAMEPAIVDGHEPMREGWISKEALDAAERMLGRKNS